MAELYEITCRSPRPQRPPQVVGGADPDFYQLACVTGTGEMVLRDSSRPFVTMSACSPGLSGSVVLQFPKRSLRLPPQRVKHLLAVPFPARSGGGRVLCQLLTGIAEQYADCSSRELIRLGQAALDLTATILGRQAALDTGLPSESRRHVLFLCIASYVDHHLGDAHLTPASLATAHGVSVRYVQRIFQEQGTTAAAFIREQRLARCRRDLTDPALRDVPVHAIGARWGFPRASDFNRAFRMTTGVSPGRYRCM
ncbi:helix-turn-helix domain-containing protein [Streptomyces sp. NPDC001492]